MAKPKKDGKRATGVQGKSGYLYIISYQHIMKDGVKVRQKQWISTGLKDTAENVKKASEMRARQLNTKHTDVSTDRNITLADYIDNFLNKKKREVSDTTSSSYFYRGNSIKEFFGDIKVKEITESMVECFLDELFEERHLQQRTVKDTNGKLFYPDYPTKTFKSLIIKMPALPLGLTLHGLRSSCVSILVHQGMDVKSIQKWVGHADYETTLKIYAKVKDKEAKKEISDKMTSVITLKEYTDHNIEQ